MNVVPKERRNEAYEANYLVDIDVCKDEASQDDELSHFTEIKMKALRPAPNG